MATPEGVEPPTLSSEVPCRELQDQSLRLSSCGDCRGSIFGHEPL